MRSLVLWMFLLCIVSYTTWTTQTSSSKEVVKTEAVSSKPLTKPDIKLIYTHHARKRMKERGANDNEVKDTLLTGEEVLGKDGAQKFEKTYPCNCLWNGDFYADKKVEVVAKREGGKWVVITVIADRK